MSSDSELSRRLAALHKEGGWPARLSLLLPLLGGSLLVAQIGVLASIVERAVMDKASFGALSVPLILLLALIALRAGIGLAGELLAMRASEEIKSGLRQHLFGDMLARPPVWTAAQSSGALSTLVVEQVQALDGYFTRYLPAMAQAALLPVAFATLVMPVDWVAGLIFLVTAPLIPIFMMLAGWGAQAASDAQAGALARLTGRFADRLRGLVTLKLFGRAEAETRAMYQASEELRRRSMRVMRIAFLSSAVLEFFAALGVAGIALYCGLSLLGLVHLRSAPLTLGAALFCLVLAPEVYQPLRLLAAHYHDRAAAKAALRSIADSLGQPAAEAGARPAGRPDGRAEPLSVAARNLTLSTPAGQPVLTHVDLDVRPGEHIALVGASGSGKSTLLESLARLRPCDAKILIGETAIGDFSEDELRERLGFIGQRPRLIVGTIAENIRLGRPDADDTAVACAARRARVTEFARHLPLRLATPVGGNGLGVSGGEAQRIALARLYLRDPGLILLDEPTAHLDAATEGQVLDELLDFAEGRTLIIATHSPAVAARMQRTYRIEDRTLVALTPSRRAATSDVRGFDLRGAA